jgi:hypothetical protein
MIDWQVLAKLSPFELALIVTLVFWTIVWKGFGLWIAAQENKKVWFLSILILNTFGILDLIYIFFFSKKGRDVVKNSWFFKMKQNKSKEKDHGIDDSNK